MLWSVQATNLDISEPFGLVGDSSDTTGGLRVEVLRFLDVSVLRSDENDEL